MQKYLIDLAKETVSNPRGAARRVVGLNLPAQILWLGFALAVSASSVLAWLTFAAAPEATSGPFQGANTSPLFISIVQAVSLLLLAAGMSFGGRIFGGAGRFNEALALTVWLELILIALQLLQLLMVLTFPLFSVLLGFAGMVLFLWVLTNFVAELHGFTHLGKVFGGILLAFVLMGVVMLTLIGAPVPVGT